MSFYSQIDITFWITTERRDSYDSISLCYIRLENVIDINKHNIYIIEKFTADKSLFLGICRIIHKKKLK